MGTCPFCRKVKQEEEPRTLLHEEKQEPLPLQVEQESSLVEEKQEPPPPEEQEHSVEEQKHAICPCGGEMKRDDMRPGWSCCSCFKMQSGTEMQWCSNHPCVYQEITGGNYVICPECYQSARTDGYESELNEEHQHPEEHRVLIQKLNESINRMS